jgi:hypothetical protein
MLRADWLLHTKVEESMYANHTQVAISGSDPSVEISAEPDWRGW